MSISQPTDPFVPCTCLLSVMQTSFFTINVESLQIFSTWTLSSLLRFVRIKSTTAGTIVFEGFTTETVNTSPSRELIVSFSDVEDPPDVLFLQCVKSPTLTTTTTTPDTATTTPDTTTTTPDTTTTTPDTTTTTPDTTATTTTTTDTTATTTTTADNPTVKPQQNDDTSGINERETPTDLASSSEDGDGDSERDWNSYIIGFSVLFGVLVVSLVIVIVYFCRRRLKKEESAGGNDGYEIPRQSKQQ